MRLSKHRQGDLTLKKLTIILALLVIVLSMIALPTLAQAPTQTDTITVTGFGSASGAPDIANLEVGVESIESDPSTAYSNTNALIDDVINALTDVGVEVQDIRTVGLNVYQDRYGGPAFSGEGQPEPVYFVSNNVRVTVRDIDNVPAVLDATINAGATNVYGLNFAIQDEATLASSARANALEDARAKAMELAELAGVELGDIVSIYELQGGFDPYNQFALDGFGGRGGGAVIEPGQLSVNVQLQITFQINR